MHIRFIAEYADGSTDPFDIPLTDLREGDHVAGIIARERQREPLCWPRLKPGKIIGVHRDPNIVYFKWRRLSD